MLTDTLESFLLCVRCIRLKSFDRFGKFYGKFKISPQNLCEVYFFDLLTSVNLTQRIGVSSLYPPPFQMTQYSNLELY